MNSSLIFELIGYSGSFLVVISMLMTSVKRLRIINTIGNLIFTVYALLIHSYPTAFMNFCLVTINAVNLFKLVKAEKTFSVIECYKDESIVQLYLKRNLKDIKRFFPEFSPEKGGHALCFLVCAEANPIGIATGKMKDEKTLCLELDYTIPAYRDFSVGKFLYAYLSEEKKISSVIFEGKLAEGDSYLEKMKFEKTAEGFVKKI